MKKMFVRDDGQKVEAYIDPLTFSRARINIGIVNSPSLDNCW